MGVVNVTPDSFSDGGRFNTFEQARLQAHRLYSEGADIIDIGGESTRPGAIPIAAQEELDRVIPLIEALHQDIPVIISIDTSKAIVMQEAINAGAGMINDVKALQGENALHLAAQTSVPICLMHMLNNPTNMQDNPYYHNVVDVVIDFLQQRVQACIAAGITKERLIIDPGFGFGKRLEHNRALFQNMLNIKKKLDLPLLMGISRKSMLGDITARAVQERVYAGIAATTLALQQQGVDIIRTHDVAATVDAVKIVAALSKIEEK